MSEWRKRAEFEIPPDVLDNLRAVYTDEGCCIWWGSRNRNMPNDDRPRIVWPHNPDAVAAEAARLAGGNFA